MRLFFALWPTPAVACRLATLAGECARSQGGRATRADTVHLTLAFLGEVSEERLPQLIAAARTLTAPRFALSIDRLGYWRHNRLWWAGCSAPPAALGELAAALTRTLDAEGFIAAAQPGGFVPHVTLVRKLTADGALAAPAFAPIRWRCSRFVLVESRLSSAGPAYRRVADFALTA